MALENIGSQVPTGLGSSLPTVQSAGGHGGIVADAPTRRGGNEPRFEGSGWPMLLGVWARRVQGTRARWNRWATDHSGLGASGLWNVGGKAPGRRWANGRRIVWAIEPRNLASWALPILGGNALGRVGSIEPRAGGASGLGAVCSWAIRSLGTLGNARGGGTVNQGKSGPFTTI